MSDFKINPITIKSVNNNLINRNNMGNVNLNVSPISNSNSCYHSIKNVSNAFSYENTETEIYTIPSKEKEFLDLFEGIAFTLNETSQYSLGLNSPTQIVKYENMYFIVNTFNNMILSSSDMIHWDLIDTPNDESFNLAHSLAFDGKNLVIADTDNKRMLSYEYMDGKFVYKEAFDDNGLKTRFHYVNYDKNSETYYAVASEFGDNTRIYEFKIPFKYLIPLEE
ncbi:MAG: hypothetical protein HFJ02_00360 [Bacilli bacterium]|nr:hypothetical protein [Bacilli bacterium]